MRFNTDLSTMEVYDGTKWLNINTPPIGSTYIQWANAANPNTIYPNTTWVSSDIENGQFIRARGGNSNVSNVNPLTGTVQDDAMQQHGHGLSGGVTSSGGGGNTTNIVNLAHSHTGSANAVGDHSHSGSRADNDGSHVHNGNTDNDGNHNHDIRRVLGIGTEMGAAEATSSTPPFVIGGGAHSHAFTTSSNGVHGHSLTISSDGGHVHTLAINASGNLDHSHTIPNHTHTNTFTIGNISVGANAGIETRPENVAVIFWRRTN
ncbi:MAG: hypothetical protein ACKVOU_05850 [Cytophagales bacterium]